MANGPQPGNHRPSRNPLLRPEQAMSLRRRAGDLLGELGAEPPLVLWVLNTPFTDAMAGPQPGPPLETDYHSDWLLVLGEEKLGLIGIPMGRTKKGILIGAAAYPTLRVRAQDFGDLERRRVFLFTFEDGSWLALGARIKPRRLEYLNDFTNELMVRCAA